MADYNFLLETRLSQDQQLALQTVQRIARAAGLNLYLTGGPMRDLLAGSPLRFLEITTEGSPVRLAGELQAAGAEHLSPHPERASLTLGLRGVRVRIAGARAGDKPTPSTIVEDLRRRGLSLNSIGLSLNPGSRGLPLDPTNGIADIEARVIRMNDPYVFVNDPMVLLRAVRLRTRLEFAMDERTQARMESAREGKYLDDSSDAARGQELEAIAYEPNPAAVLSALDQEQWLEAAFGKGVRAAKMNLAALGRLSGVIEAWEHLGLGVDTGLAAVPFLLSGLGPSDQNRLAHLFPSRHLAEWKRIPTEARSFEKRLMAAGGGPGTLLGRMQAVIEKTAPEVVAYVGLHPGEAKVARKLEEFQTAALGLRQRLPLGILRAAGLAPHSLEAEGVLRPWYRRLLQGEALSDVDLAEGLRQAAEELRPRPLAPAAPAGAAGKGSGKGGGAKSEKNAMAKAAATPPPPAKPVAEPPAKAAHKPVGKPASQSARQPAVKPASQSARGASAKPAPKAAVKPASRPAQKATVKPVKPVKAAKAAKAATRDKSKIGKTALPAKPKSKKAQPVPARKSKPAAGARSRR